MTRGGLPTLPCPIDYSHPPVRTNTVWLRDDGIDSLRCLKMWISFKIPSFFIHQQQHKRITFSILPVN